MRDFGGTFTPPPRKKRNASFEAYLDGYPASFKQCAPKEKAGKYFGKYESVQKQLKVNNRKVFKNRNDPTLNGPDKVDLYIDAPNVSSLEIIKNINDLQYYKDLGTVRDIYIYTKEGDWFIFF